MGISPHEGLPARIGFHPAMDRSQASPKKVSVTGSTALPAAWNGAALQTITGNRRSSLRLLFHQKMATIDM
jgi:hypothetical protein